MMRGIPHCERHFGFPAATCAVCAQPGGIFDVNRADSARAMRPATTTAAARTRRLAADAEARKRGGR